MDNKLILLKIHQPDNYQRLIRMVNRSSLDGIREVDRHNLDDVAVDVLRFWLLAGTDPEGFYHGLMGYDLTIEEARLYAEQIILEHPKVQMMS